MCQNVSNEVLLAWFKFQAKISSCWSMRSRRVTKIPPLSPPLSKDEGLRDIGHSMSIGNLILGVNSVTVSYLIHYDSLLQNATDIIKKMRQLFYYEMQQKFMTKCVRFLMINATVYYKLWQYIVNLVLPVFRDNLFLLNQ